MSSGRSASEDRMEDIARALHPSSLSNAPSPLNRLVTAGLPGRAEACAALMQSPIDRFCRSSVYRKPQEAPTIREHVGKLSSISENSRAASATRIRVTLASLLLVGATRATLFRSAKLAASVDTGPPPISAPEIQALTVAAIDTHLRKNRRSTRG